MRSADLTEYLDARKFGGQCEENTQGMFLILEEEHSPCTANTLCDLRKSPLIFSGLFQAAR
jgi:hypothetical protein